jgi:hypothetical protein
MPKENIDTIFGYSVKMCWGWDEQRIAPPLGYGNGLMVWPYRNSLHFMQDQCLRFNRTKVPNLKNLFEIYHQNITSKLSWWKELVAPRIKLRARMWEGFEIYVGLKDELRKNPMVMDGMILIGDVAGLESTELCDGVPAAWFSSEIAARVAIEAIEANDYSKEFLNTYETKVRNHPIIKWSISGRNRYNLRLAQKTHSLKQLKEYIHNGWGLGSLSTFTTPFLKMLFSSINEDPGIITSWIKMSFRYYKNWIYENYDYSKKRSSTFYSSKEIRKKEIKFLRWMRFIDIGIKVLLKMKKILKIFIVPLSNSMNSFLGQFLPIFEPLYHKLIALLTPLTNKMSNNLIEFVSKAHPSIFISHQRGENLDG